MRNFTKSLGRFSWAVSLFGLGGLAGLLGGRREAHPADSAAAAFDSATGTLEQGLGQPFRTMFQLGDRMFEGAVDLLFDRVPSRSGKAGCGCGQSSSGPKDAWAPGVSESGPMGAWPPGAPGSGSPRFDDWVSGPSGSDDSRAADSRPDDPMDPLSGWER